MKTFISLLEKEKRCDNMEKNLQLWSEVMTKLWCKNKLSIVNGLQTLEPWSTEVNAYAFTESVFTLTADSSFSKPSQINTWSSSVYLQEIL